MTSGRVPADVQTASLDAAALAMKARPSESAMIQQAKAVIARFAKEDPDRIGGPIDVLVLDAHGAHWKPRKPSCGSGD